MITKVNVCKCNNCDTLLIDENPQIDGQKYDLTNDLHKMVLREDIDEVDRTESHYYWACPNCLTDGFLTDI